jgi:hypothetical protein
MQPLINVLLDHACPSIRSRIRREILGETRLDQEVSALQEEILNDNVVRGILSSQHSSGWIFQNFHGYDSMESSIRVLCEKDLDPLHPQFSKALGSLKVNSERLYSGIGKVGHVLDATSFGGSQLIRASLLAQAGQEKDTFVQDQIPLALNAFSAVISGKTIDDYFERHKGKLNFRTGVVWPSIYHLRLLAFTYGWRSIVEYEKVAKAINRMVEWSPLPKAYIRHRSQLIAPASFALHDLNPDLQDLDDAGWMIWFHRMELLSRLGVIHRVPQLDMQVKRLQEIMMEGNGRFAKNLSHTYFRKWGAYTGLMLEEDWRKPERREMDLSFRSLLILHYFNKQAS